VSDDEGGAAFDEALEGGLDAVLGAGVNGGGGLVEDEYAGVGDHGTGETDELTLAGGRIKQFRVKDQKESSPRAALQLVPKAIMARQSCSVDASSGATCTSYGLMTATMRALSGMASPASPWG
jgi:hypothetical protein